jgi:hypothetical protein
MKKKEALDFIRKEKGYIPYLSLFEMFNENDNIPEQLISLECKKDESKANFIIGSKLLCEQLKNLK